MYHIRFDLASAFEILTSVLAIWLLDLLGWEGEIRVYGNLCDVCQWLWCETKYILEILRYNTPEKVGVLQNIFQLVVADLNLMHQRRLLN